MLHQIFIVTSAIVCFKHISSLTLPPSRTSSLHSTVNNGMGVSGGYVHSSLSQSNVHTLSHHLTGVEQTGKSGVLHGLKLGVRGHMHQVPPWVK